MTGQVHRPCPRCGEDVDSLHSWSIHEGTWRWLHLSDETPWTTRLCPESTNEESQDGTET